MALFAAIGDRFIAKILKQVASDYNLDYEEMKSRYCGDMSFELSMPTKEFNNQITVDLEVVPANPKVPAKPKVPKPKVPKVSRPKAPRPNDDAPIHKEPTQMALSKMKKPDLVLECEEHGLDSEGTVAQLKDRVKDARAASGVHTKAKPKPRDKVKYVPPLPPVPLEEEDGSDTEEVEPDSPGGIRAKHLREDPDEFEEEVDDQDDLQARLRKILAEAEDEEFDDDEYDEN